MTIIELRPQSLLRIKRKHSLSAELVLLPMALVASLAGLLPLAIEETLRVTVRAFKWRL